MIGCLEAGHVLISNMMRFIVVSHVDEPIRRAEYTTFVEQKDCHLGLHLLFESADAYIFFGWVDTRLL